MKMLISSEYGLIISGHVTVLRQWRSEKNRDYIITRFTLILMSLGQRIEAVSKINSVGGAITRFTLIFMTLGQRIKIVSKTNNVRGAIKRFT